MRGGWRWIGKIVECGVEDPLFFFYTGTYYAV